MNCEDLDLEISDEHTISDLDEQQFLNDRNNEELENNLNFQEKNYSQNNENSQNLIQQKINTQENSSVQSTQNQLKSQKSNQIQIKYISDGNYNSDQQKNQNQFQFSDQREKQEKQNNIKIQENNNLNEEKILFEIENKYLQKQNYTNECNNIKNKKIEKQDSQKESQKNKYMCQKSGENFVKKNSIQYNKSIEKINNKRNNHINCTDFQYNDNEQQKFTGNQNFSQSSKKGEQKQNDFNLKKQIQDEQQEEITRNLNERFFQNEGVDLGQVKIQQKNQNLQVPQIFDRKNSKYKDQNFSSNNINNDQCMNLSLSIQNYDKNNDNQKQIFSCQFQNKSTNNNSDISNDNNLGEFQSQKLETESNLSNQIVKSEFISKEQTKNLDLYGINSNQGCENNDDSYQKFLKNSSQLQNNNKFSAKQKENQDYQLQNKQTIDENYIFKCLKFDINQVLQQNKQDQKSQVQPLFDVESYDGEKQKLEEKNSNSGQKSDQSYVEDEDDDEFNQELEEIKALRINKRVGINSDYQNNSKCEQENFRYLVLRNGQREY
ncbi:hypothetical protein PPERSA_00186 [Pseudocohnilembus persalinus]|uniref:Uncharacterized protein n=1 Tax=Pseudocohnilembus persalinus TaxID=266149 RepID=A0A0V0QQD4_PSEPJ|nr:hypothetical protein PPERSA_00186 [Pseudocohnilembus persalinus]|eukprot:KRX04417.1 hypothetical protein PPERSA_00186 [Pseudocohnilembus persalinus]